MFIVLSTSNLAACRQGQRKKMTYKCIPSSKSNSTPFIAANLTAETACLNHFIQFRTYIMMVICEFINSNKFLLKPSST